MNFNEINPLSVSSLSAAVERNDVVALRRLIKKGRNPNITDNRGWTPLHEAASRGYLKCLNALVKSGARLDVTTHDGKTPFFVACEFKRLEVLKILLRLDRNLVNFSNEESVTPLHRAVTLRDIDLVKYLIIKGANINAEDNDGLTPLQEAILQNNVEITELLINKGANIHSREYDGGHLPLHFSCMACGAAIFRVILNKHREEGSLQNVINATTCSGQTPLFIACKTGAVEIVEELLRLGADANIVTNKNNLALHAAAFIGNVSTFKQVLKATSSSSVNKYCTLPANKFVDLKNNDWGTSREKSLVCLMIDSMSLECVKFLMSCGLSYDVLNCPVISTEFLPIMYEEMRAFQNFGPHMNIEIDVLHEDLEIMCSRRRRVFVLYPVVFLLKEKKFALFSNTSVYLNFLLKNGLTFNHAEDFYNEHVIVLHPFDAIFSNLENKNFVDDDNNWKRVIKDSLCMLFEHGCSVDYNVQSGCSSIPILFVYACRLAFLDLIPHLLLHSNLVDIDDLLRWVVHKLFLRADPPPYVIEKSLFETYQYLIQYTCKTFRSFLDDINQEEYAARFQLVASIIDSNCLPKVSSLKMICRSVITKTIRETCRSCPLQFKAVINNLQLPFSVISFLNYKDMLES